MSDFVNSWWCNPRSLYSSLRDTVYQGGVDANETMFIAELDLRRRTAKKIRLGTFEIDDHNVPALLMDSDKPPVDAYARHAVESVVRYRIGTVPMDLDTLGAEQQVTFPGACTYVHLLRRPGTSTYAILTRNADGWYLRVSLDRMVTWKPAVKFAGLSYQTFNVHDGVAHYALTTHPITDPNNSIYKLRISLATGVIYNEAGTVIDNLWNFSGTAILKTQMTYARQSYDTDTVYNTNRTFDCLSDGSVLAMRLLKATPQNGGMYGVYRRSITGATPSSAQGIDGAQRGWVWEPIVASGVPVGYYQSSYVGGMTAGANENEVYLSREQAGAWRFERWTKTGITWSLAETLRTFSDGTKLGRPQVPWGAYGTGIFLGIDYFNYPTDNFIGYYGDDVVLETGVQSSVPVKDTTAPSTPGGVASAATSDGAVLTWNASTGSPIAYDIYDGSTRIATVTGLTYTVTGLASGVPQTAWFVRALDAAGNQSTANTFPSFTPSAPITQDPMLNAGTMVLIDRSNQYGAWAAGVPADGSTITNLARTQALAIAGSGAASDWDFKVSNTLTASDGLVERTSKGGLHSLVSQSTGVAGRKFVLSTETLRAFLAANTSDDLFVSLWETTTRLSAETTPGTLQRAVGFLSAASGDTQSVRLATGNKFTVAPSANRLGDKESATPAALNAPANINAAHSSITAPGSNPNYVFAGHYDANTVNKGASWILYRVTLENLRVSGRTYADAAAQDLALFNAATGSGGRYNGDTFTAVVTLP